MQKLARAVIGTNNMDNCSRYCQAPATMGLFRTVGYGGDSGSIKDIENAGLVLIIGSNTAESHPVLAIAGEGRAQAARAKAGGGRHCASMRWRIGPIFSSSRIRERT